jgi:uncharacterized coiled-coil DUF342 family protein
MEKIKTVIRKFLWFDITPRKELYNELNECYEKITSLNKTINDLRVEISKMMYHDDSTSY